jgi:Zinc-binding
MTFMVNSRPPLLWQHVQAKHPPGTAPTDCFPVQLKDFDPNDPTGEKAAKEAAASGAAAAPPKPKKVVKKDLGLDALLDAGLAGKKGKK